MSLSAQLPLTTYEISRYLHVDLTTVIHWCDEGKLRAYRTPGGHRRVQPEMLLAFLKEFQIPMPSLLAERMRPELKILVVDDEPELRRMVQRTLKKRFPESRVLEAQDGFEAGKLVADHQPDLVILDLRLPGVDGFRVCALIRSDVRLKNAKILAITGQNTPENKRRILQTGADAYMAKPFDPDQFIQKVQELLETPDGSRVAAGMQEN